MSRTQLLGAASAAALACLSGAAFAQESTTAITGGGSTLAEYEYFGEFTSFNGTQAAGAPIFSNLPSGATGSQNTLYWPAGSGSGQAAFLTNDNSCNSNKVLSLNSKNCNATYAPGGLNAVDYGASDSPFSASQINLWNEGSVAAGYLPSQDANGQVIPAQKPLAGPLVQLPSMGFGIAIPIRNADLTTNGGTTLDDADLCGIFSGKFTNWSQTSGYLGKTGKPNGTLAATPIVVNYRSDGSGTSYVFLNHLAAVCNSTNSNFPNATATTSGITPSQTFLTVFGPAGGATAGTAPANFVGASGSSGVANNQSGATVVTGLPTGYTEASSTSYLSPDFTAVYPCNVTGATVVNGACSPANTFSKPSYLNLIVPSIKAGTPNVGGTVATGAFLPTVTNIIGGLGHAIAAVSQYTTPPTGSVTKAENQTAWVPQIGQVSTGYPIVGYTTFDFAQCYASYNIGTAIVAFLTDHYGTSTTYINDMETSGFVPISKSGASTFATPITNTFLTNNYHYSPSLQIQASGLCASATKAGTYAGR